MFVCLLIEQVGTDEPSEIGVCIAGLVCAFQKLAIKSSVSPSLASQSHRGFFSTSQSTERLHLRLRHALPRAMSTTATTTEARAEPITAETILRLFPDIDTRGDALEGHDEEQIRLMDEVCIVLDEDDVPIGKASKKICAWYDNGRVERQG